MQSRRFTIAALSALFVTVVATNAQAQTSCGNTSATTATCSPAGTQVTTTVNKIVRLTVTPASASLTAPTDADFAASGTAAIVDAALHALTVRANVNWAITIQGSAWTGTGNNSKLVGDLEWTSNGGTNYSTMTTSAVALTSGAATAGSSPVNIGYRTTWHIDTDTPGTYTMALTFNISST